MYCKDTLLALIRGASNSVKSVRDSQIPVRDSWILVTKIKGSVVKRGWIKGLCPRIPLKNLCGIPILLLTPRINRYTYG